MVTKHCLCQPYMEQACFLQAALEGDLMAKPWWQALVAKLGGKAGWKACKELLTIYRPYCREPPVQFPSAPTCIGVYR